MAEDLFESPTFLEREEEIVETPVIEETEQKEEEASFIEAGKSLNNYESRIEALYSEGLLGFDRLPAEFEHLEVFGADETIALLEAALRNTPTRTNQVVEESQQKVFEEVVNGMSDITRKAYEFELNNNDPDDLKEFLKTLVFEQDIRSLSPETQPEEIIREWGKAQGNTKEQIEEQIDDLKQLNKLERKAQEIKPLLDKKVEEIAARKVEEQNSILQMEHEAKANVAVKLEQAFKEGIGIPLDSNMEKFLRKILVEDEVEVPYKGKKITIGAAEYLTMFHRHSEKGNLKQLAKAMIFLQYPQVFDKYYQLKALEKETNSFLKEHKISNSVKTGLFANRDIEPKRTDRATFLR